MLVIYFSNETSKYLIYSTDKFLIAIRLFVKIEFDDDKYKKYNKELTVIAKDGENESVFSKNSVGVKKGDKKLITTYIDEREATLIMEILKVEKPDTKDDSKEEDKNKEYECR